MSSQYEKQGRKARASLSHGLLLKWRMQNGGYANLAAFCKGNDFYQLLTLTNLNIQTLKSYEVGYIGPASFHGILRQLCVLGGNWTVGTSTRQAHAFLVASSPPLVSTGSHVKSCLPHSCTSSPGSQSHLREWSLGESLKFSWRLEYLLRDFSAADLKAIRLYTWSLDRCSFEFLDQERYTRRILDLQRS